MTDVAITMSSEIDDEVEANAASEVTDVPVDAGDQTASASAPTGLTTGILLTLAFVGAEALSLTNLALQAGALGVVLMGALSVAVFTKGARQAVGVVVGSLASVRLVTLTLPFGGISLPTRVAIVGVFSIGIWILAVVALRTNVVEATENGVTRRRRINGRRLGITALVTLSGAPIAWLVWAAHHPTRFVLLPLQHSHTNALVVAGLALFVGALGDELLYRQLVSRMVPKTAQLRLPLFAGALYGATFIGSRDGAMIAIATGTGVFLGWVYQRTGLVRGPVFAHTVINIGAFMVLRNLV